MPAGASIINFASVTFHQAPATWLPMSPPKAHHWADQDTGARAWSASHSRHTLSPGWIMTERQLRQFVTAKVKRMIKDRSAFQICFNRRTCRSRSLSPSDASRAVTGQEILADRGWYHS